MIMIKYLFAVLQLCLTIPLSAQQAFVPIGGNTWAYSHSGKAIKEEFKNGHIDNWNNPSIYYETFIRFAQKTNLELTLEIEQIHDGGTFEISLGASSKKIKINKNSKLSLPIGNFELRDTGYHAIRIAAVELQGKAPIITGYSLSAKGILNQLHYVKNNEGNFFYWGRRGPSVHMGYTQPAQEDIEWYYNEVTVPIGNDIIGSYYMANGFKEGYFGMQVNSESERRILFSVWSPFVTDDPKSIPEEQKIILKAKGSEVYTGEFGNEGSGGQSYLRFNWKAGNTYKFLLRGRPIAQNYTEYTAWFFAPELGKWLFIAQFERPQTQTYLKGFHSFLENFSTAQGIYERQVLFSNQWVCNRAGKWTELTEGRFSIDNTARQGYRLDYAGGISGNSFYLRNCGFFSDYTPAYRMFKRESSNNPPEIDFTALEKK